MVLRLIGLCSAIVLLAGCTVGPQGVSGEGAAGLFYQGLEPGWHEDRFRCADGQALVSVGAQMAGNGTVRVRVTDAAGALVHDRSYGHVSGDVDRAAGTPGEWVVRADRVGDPGHGGAFSGSYQVDVDCGDGEDGPT